MLVKSYLLNVGGCDYLSITTYVILYYVIILRNNDQQYSLDDTVRYSISVTRAKCVPAFGPDLPDGPIFTANDLFRDFILTKIVNGHNSTPKGMIHKFFP